MLRQYIISYIGVFLTSFLYSFYAQAKEANLIYDSAIEAYVYGYSLVLMHVTKEVVTNVSKPHPNGRAPINQFSHTESFPTPDDIDIVSPNADTLYSTAWLDLTKEPIILQLPDTHDRYYLMPILDAWSNVIASPGKRTSGTHAQNFAITGPNWQGVLPVDVTEIRSPTTIVWILGRTQTNGKEDYKNVHTLQKHYKLIPLSHWGAEYIPHKMPIDRDQDMTAPVKQVEMMGAETFFNHLAMLMKDNPPAPEDEEILRKLNLIGVIPGEPYSFDGRNEEFIETVNMATKAAYNKIKYEGQRNWNWENNWLLAPMLGEYGTNYMQRAAVAMYGLGANLPEDAIYPMISKDIHGKKLSGKNKYVIHFEKDEIPPVNAFWSLTMYNSDHLFVDNELERYALGDRDPLKLNKDGSLDIYIQHKNPGPQKVSNWLPAPKDDFNMILRLYWPKESVVDGEWIPPGIVQ